MFWNKPKAIEPAAVAENVIIIMSEPVVITAKTTITVPAQYKAIAYIDYKPQIRIAPCLNVNFVKEYGKEYIGKQLMIAFILNKTLAQSPWGFGNVQVNNERLKEAYRIGANGKFSVNIVDHEKLVQAFPNVREITIDQIREKLISTIKTVGTPILGDYFTNSATSVFEMSSLISDFRDRFLESLEKEKVFVNMGIKIATLTVDGFHVNEDDLELIRNRINA